MMGFSWNKCLSEVFLDYVENKKKDIIWRNNIKLYKL